MTRLLLALPFLALPAQAGTFTPPEGCTGWMTVQARACRVSNYYKCSADAAGDQWRADFDQDGMFFASRIDHEAQWLESLSIPEGTVQTLDANPVDAASFSTLLATNLDTWDFRLTKDNGEKRHVTGQDALTGASVTIDGITLQQTAFEANWFDPEGNIIERARGNEYIHPEWRMFFSGPGETDLGDGQWRPIDGRPVEFIFPGEPGFMSTQPVFECDALMSKAVGAEQPIPASYEGSLP
ncbi:hypothetical protein [Neogemmobacter tilapiae]|uniref:DUF3108 domain-containing protein n=1 Tax=Neogemmobacter tilapiae TaxID=875041 RepID=A0A918TNN4_9RHOB|nr:hypothetical protein [Gemmobacter tilapiae]GHC50092.1 hypothetical protein GCM10007315_10360 [Gemmobacter tilapiae]